MSQLTPILAQLMPIVTHSGLWTTVLAASATLLARSIKNPYVRGRDWPLVSVEYQNKMQKGFKPEKRRNIKKPKNDPFALKAKQIFEKAVMEVKSQKSYSKTLSGLAFDLMVARETSYKTSYSTLGIVVIDKSCFFRMVKGGDSRLDDKLAFIICHEIGHIVSWHSGLGVAQILLRLPLFGFMKQEKKADEIAAKLTAQIGYDPRARLEFAIDHIKHDPEIIEFLEGYMAFMKLLDSNELVDRVLKSLYMSFCSVFPHLPYSMVRAKAMMHSGAMEKAIQIYESGNPHKPCTPNVWPQFEVPITGEVVLSGTKPDNSFSRKFQDFLAEHL